MHRRKFLQHSSIAGIVGLAGCIDGLSVDDESRVSDEDTESTDNESSSSTTDTESTGDPQTELQQLGLRLEEQYEEEVDGLTQTVWELRNTGDNKILATDAITYAQERRFSGDLRVSGADSEKWIYGIGPGANIKIWQNTAKPINGKAYLPEDVPLSPPSEADVIVESPEWTTTEAVTATPITALSYEFDNPTPLDLSNVQETSPETVTVVDNSTLQYAATRGGVTPAFTQTWKEPLAVTLTTTTGEESFTLAPAQVPEYDIAIKRVGRGELDDGIVPMEVSFDVTAQNEVGIFDCRAIIFNWPYIGGVQTAMTYATQVGQGEDWGEGSPLVVDTTGQDRIGETVNYTLESRYLEDVLDLPLEDNAEVGVMLMFQRTPVAYSEVQLTDVLDEDSLQSDKEASVTY